MMSITAARVDHPPRVDAAAAGAPLRSIEPRHNIIFIFLFLATYDVICENGWAGPILIQAYAQHSSSLPSL